MSILKKNKWLALKDIIERLVKEDPLLAFFLTFCILPSAMMLLDAVRLNNYTQIFTVIITLSGITIIVIIPLLLIKNHKMNETRRTTEEIAINKRKFELHRDIELNKQHRYNQLLDAKINSIKQETNYLRDSMKEQETQMIIATARQLANILQGDRDAENSILANHFKETLKDIAEKLGSQSGKHDKLLIQIKELEENIEKANLPSKIESASSPEELESEEKKRSSKDAAVNYGNLKQCTHCNEYNQPNDVRCKNCRKFL
jgi:uncharacterized membrane-anchored protein YjiN (DUF445 family)